LQTAFVPEKDVYNMTKKQLLGEMDVAMGGRVAEEIIFGSEEVTTGQKNYFFKKLKKMFKFLVKFLTFYCFRKM
jgi:ATP-dependent Zn protease